MEPEDWIAADLPRIDASEKVTGKAIYGIDLKISGMLCAKVLRSPLPHAKILNVDLSRAKRLPGVRVVVTGKDVPDRYGVLLRDQSALGCGKVRYIGDPVAGVAAVDEETAEEAIERIKVDYEELPAVFDPVEGMQPGAVLVHDNLHEYWHSPNFLPLTGTNICNHFKLRRGNIEDGFRQSDLIEESTYRTPMIQHCHLEPHVCIAQADPSGQVTIWSGTQSPYSVRREMARYLNLPLNRVRVIVPWLGGAFGAKGAIKIEPLCIALALRERNHRPVKLVMTREEEFHAVSGGVRHPTIIQIKAGIRKDGMLMAWKVKAILDTGAYADVGPMVTRSLGMSASGPYRIPNIWVDAYCVYTNNPVAGAFRGFGVPQLMWAIDSHLDILAERVGMDPVELRLKNALEEGDISATGQILHSVGIKECIQKAAGGIGWGTKSGKNRGKGMGTMYKMTQTPTSSTAIVKLNEDGSADVLVSTVDMGQGSNTIWAQITAKELGVDVHKVKVSAPDTDLTPYDAFTASSRSTFHMGNAVRLAAVDARKQLLEMAAQQLETLPQYLEAKGGFIYQKGSTGKGIPISEIRMGLTYGKGKPIIGKGIFTVPDATPLDQETGQGDFPSVFWLYGAQAVEVEVDPTTGKVEVLRVVAAHDLGRVINPVNCTQQIEGALVQGIGLSLMEELLTRRGRVLNSNFRDYRVPTVQDDVPEVSSLFVEARHREGPYGAKGVGEPALAPTAAAIGNAVYRAIGLRIKDLPITPEKILKALREKRKVGI